MRPVTALQVQRPLDALHEAFISLHTLGKRSLLALLGVSMGSASVIALLTIGNNAASEAQALFRGMGVDTLVVRFPTPVAGVDSAQLMAQVPALHSIAPVIQASAALVYRGRAVHASLVGSDAALQDVLGSHLEAGRFLSPFDQRATFAVLGHRLAGELSGEGKPLQVGDHVRINDYVYEVLGILQDQPDSLLMPFRASVTVFVPSYGMRRLEGRAQLSELVMRALPNQDMPAVGAAIRTALVQQLGEQGADIYLAQQMIEGMTRQSRTFNYLLLALAGISLAAAGVGIMNVMLMNVSQRKREIGVRMALGARGRDIRYLFLFEAFALTAVGAMFGSVFGVSCAWVYSTLSGWSFSLASSSMLLGVGSTLLAGLFFGLYPAMAAARLQPVEALREE